MAAPAKLIFDSVGLATRFVREHWRLVLAVSALISVVITALSALSEVVPAASLLSVFGSGFLQAALYAGLIATTFVGRDAARRRWLTDTTRVWAAMVIVVFFMAIALFVLSMVISITLLSGPLNHYAPELQRAGNNNALVMSILVRFANENPIPVAIGMLVFFAVWLVLTSRLYLAAPATVDRQRIQTLETWSMTRGVTLKIIGARLLLLAPAYALVFALSNIIGRGLGVNTLDIAAMSAAAESNSVGFTAYVLIGGFVGFALYSSLEAALAAYLYRALRAHAR